MKEFDRYEFLEPGGMIIGFVFLAISILTITSILAGLIVWVFCK